MPVQDNEAHKHLYLLTPTIGQLMETNRRELATMRRDLSKDYYDDKATFDARWRQL